MEGRPIQIEAEVKFRICGPKAKEHNYTVTATSSDFDMDEFLRKIPDSATQDSDNVASAANGPSNPLVSAAGVAQQAIAAQSTRPESRRADDDVVEIRPFKRQKAHEDAPRPRLSLDATKDLKGGSKSNEDVFDFLQQWHGEWVRQGGFLYDQLSAYQPFVQSKVANLEK